MTLSAILSDLCSKAEGSGVAWRMLQRGLLVKVMQTEGTWRLEIAREHPSLPSGFEENTVIAALGPLFAGPWQRRTNVRGNGGKRYNISECEFTPSLEEA